MELLTVKFYIISFIYVIYFSLDGKVFILIFGEISRRQIYKSIPIRNMPRNSLSCVEKISAELVTLGQNSEIRLTDIKY